MKFVIALGLPGSGKTKTLDDVYENYLQETHEITFVEELHPTTNLYDKIMHEINLDLEFNNYIPEMVIVDTLLKDLNELKEFKDIANKISFEFGDETRFEVYLFKPEEEYALINDFNRNRQRHARDTIEYMSSNWEFDRFSVEDILCNCNIIDMNVWEPTESEYYIWKSQVKNYRVNFGRVQSEPWTLGGLSRGIDASFNDEYMDYDKESPHEDFSELQEFLKGLLGEKYDDEIYDYIFDNHVEVIEKFHDDYYDTWHYAQYEILISDVIEVLKDKGYEI